MVNFDNFSKKDIYDLTDTTKQKRLGTCRGSCSSIQTS